MGEIRVVGDPFANGQSGFPYGAVMSSITTGTITPNQLPNLALWLRADMGITIGTGVSAWADQSGNGNNFTQGTGSAQPTLNASDASFGGQASLSFAAANSQTLTATSVTISQPDTIYVIGQFTTSSNAELIDGNGTRQALANNSGANFVFYAGTLVTGSAADLNPHAFAAIYNGASSSMYVDTSSAANASGNAGANNWGGLILGGTIGGFLQGKIAEVVTYSAAHTSAQVAQLFKYFAGRYGKAWG